MAYRLSVNIQKLSKGVCAFCAILNFSLVLWDLYDTSEGFLMVYGFFVTSELCDYIEAF